MTTREDEAPVAWADDRIAAGIGGDACGAATKRLWETGDNIDRVRASRLRHPLYSAAYVARLQAELAARDRVIAAADAMRAAFARNPGHWPQMGWTPIDFDTARAAMDAKP